MNFATSSRAPFDAMLQQRARFDVKKCLVF